VLMNRAAFGAACTGALTAALLKPAPAVRAQAPPTVLRVSSVLSDELTPVLYAQRSGMYAKAGLDLQIVPGSSGAAVTTAVLAGDIEIGKSSLISLMNAHLRGIPLSVIGGSNIYDPNHPYAQIVVAANSPFTSAKDLNGKTIGVPSLNDLNVLACDLWLDKNGGDSKSVKYVELPNPSLTAALTGHRTDEAVMTFPVLADALASHELKALGSPYGAIGPDFLISVWFVANDWAKQHAATVKTFLDVTQQSAKYTNQHNSETAPMVADLTKIPLAVINGMPRLVSSTGMSNAQIQAVLDGAAKYGLIPHTFPARDLVWSGLGS
jgi:NitT/TauT family transport system substrate-binding protein